MVCGPRCGVLPGSGGGVAIGVITHWNVAVGWARCVICEFSACSVVVAGILAVTAKHSFGLALISHVALFATSEAHWCISVVG